MDFNKLKEPLKFNEIEWKVQSKKKDKQGKVDYTIIVPYINRKTVINRFDECIGFGKWRVEFREWHDTRTLGGTDLEFLKYVFNNQYVKNDFDLASKIKPFFEDNFSKSQICRISIKIDDEWVYKEDGAENTDIESTKGGISSAFKRCANMWGIGLELSDFPLLKIDGDVSYLTNEHLNFFKKILETPIEKRSYSYTFTKNQKDLFENAEEKAVSKEQELISIIRKIADKDEYDKIINYYAVNSLSELSYDDLVFTHDNLVKKRKPMSKEEIKNFMAEYPANRNLKEDMKKFFKKDNYDDLSYYDMSILKKLK